MRNKIYLDGYKDAVEFNAICQTLGDDINVTVTDGANQRVSGKSLLGMLYTLEFNELFVESNCDIYKQIEKFIVV
jgi:hypothetical protein